MPTQLNGVKKVIVVDDGTTEKFVALGKWTATDTTSSVIQTSTDATTWTKMDYVSDPYGGAFRDDLITDEFDGSTYGEHLPPGTFYNDIGLTTRLFRLPDIRSEYPNSKWKKFHNYTTSSANVLVGLTTNLSDDAGFAYSAISSSKGQVWVIGTLAVPSQRAEDEAWVDIVAIFVDGVKTYVAVTNYGQVATSTNGYTWTYGVIDKTLLTGERIQGLAVYSTTPTSDGTIFAVTNRNAYRSTNLTAWTKDSSTSWADYPVSDVIVDNGYIMVVSTSGGSVLIRYKYIDGGTWSFGSPTGSADNIKQIVPFGNRYIFFTTANNFISATKNPVPGINNAPYETLSNYIPFPEPVTFATAWNDLATPVLYAFVNRTQGANVELWKMTAPNYGTFSLVNSSAIPNAKKSEFVSGGYINAFTTTGTSGPVSGTDRLALVDGFGNSYYKTYSGTQTDTNSTFTLDLNDVEFQAYAESLVQSSPNSTKYQQYLGFFGAGNRFPQGSNWELMANDNYRKVALNLGTTTTARSDNYEVMLPSGTMNVGRTWQDLAYGANKYVAIAQNGFEWSVNGSVWNLCTRPSDASSYAWNTITYMPFNGISSGRFYAVAQNSNKAMSSTDGIIWSYTTDLPAIADYRSSESSSDLSVFVKGSSNTCVVSNHSVPVTYATQTLPSTKTWNDIVHGYHYSTHSTTADNATQYTSPILTPALVDGYIKHDITKSYMTVNGVKTNVAVTPVSLVADTKTTYMYYAQNGLLEMRIGQSDVSKVNPADHWGDWVDGTKTFTFLFRASSDVEQDPTNPVFYAEAIMDTGGTITGSKNWLVGDRMLIKGSKYGGVDGVNDIIVTVTELGIRSGGVIVNPTAIWRMTAAPAPGNTGYLNLPGGRYASGASLTAVRNTTTGVYTRTLVGGSGFQVNDVLTSTTNDTSRPFYPLPRPHNVSNNIQAVVTSVGSGGVITGLQFRDTTISGPLFTLPTTQAPEWNLFRIRTISNTSSVALTPADMTSRFEYDNGNPDPAIDDSNYILAKSGDVYRIAGSYFNGSSYDLTWKTAEQYDSVNKVAYYSIPRGPATATIQVRMTPGNTTPTLSIINGGSGYTNGTASINGAYCGGTSSQAIEFTIGVDSNGTITSISAINGVITAPTLPTFTVGKLGTAYNNITMNSAGTGISANTQFKILGTIFKGATPTNDLIITAATTNLSKITGSNLDGRVLTFTTSGTASWTPATLKVVRNKKVNNITITNGGAGHIVGNAVRIDGADIGGTSTHDITITPTAVSSTGAITAFTSSYIGLEGRFVAVGPGADNAYSNDGFTWTATTLPNQNWSTITYTKNSDITITGDSSSQTGLYIAANDSNSVIAISIDGITWIQKALPKSSTWKQIAFFKDRFILLDGTRYPLISNKITSLDATQANINLVWNDYGEEYLSYWTSTEMTDLVYIGGKYIGVGKGTLPDGSTIPLVWKATTLSGAKATWRLYGTASDLGQLSNIINVGGDFTFIAEDNVATPGNAIKKFTTTFINDTTTTGYLIPLSQTTDFPGSDTTGYSKIEATGSKLYLTKKNGSVITYDIS